MALLRLLCPLVCAGVLQSPLVRAEERECAGVVVNASPQVVSAWPDLPRKIAETLASRPAIDTCAHVRLSKAERAIDIDVRLVDGRVAARSVPSIDDVIPALEGLLLMPEFEPEAPVIEQQAPSIEREESEAPVVERQEPAPASEQPRRLRPDSGLSDSGVATAEPSAVSFELSAITGLRGGDGPTSGSLGAVALLNMWDWLLAFDGRAHAIHAANTLEVTLTAGHRFSPGSLELDVLLGLAAEARGPDHVREGAVAIDAEPRPDGEPWFYVASRLHLAPRSALGLFIGVEALSGVMGPEDVGPERLQGEDVWMAGIVAGATVGTP